MWGDLPRDVYDALRWNLRGDLDKSIREYVLRRDKHRCVNCGIVRPSQNGRVYKGRPIYLTIDHIKPRRDSGNNHPNNLRVLCCRCHEFLNINDRLPERNECLWLQGNTIPANMLTRINRKNGHWGLASMREPDGDYVMFHRSVGNIYYRWIPDKETQMRGISSSMLDYLHEHGYDVVKIEKD